LVKEIPKIAVERDATLTGLVRRDLRAGAEKDKPNAGEISDIDLSFPESPPLLVPQADAGGPADVVTLLDASAPIKVIHADGKLVRRALEARAKYGVAFYGGRFWPPGTCRIRADMVRGPKSRPAIFRDYGGNPFEGQAN